MSRFSVRTHAATLLQSLRGCQRSLEEERWYLDALRLQQAGDYPRAVLTARRAFAAMLLRAHYGSGASFTVGGPP